MVELSLEQEEILTTNILQQTKYFLDNADEFYPFGTVIDKNNQIKPTSAYLGQEHPDSVELLIYLENAITSGILDKNYKCAAIGIDILINHSGDGKESGVEIRLYAKDFFKKIYYLYFKREGSYSFTEYRD